MQNRRGGRRTVRGFMTIVGFGLALLCSTPAPVHADLEDLLLEKGSLTKEEWLKLKAEKEQSEALQQQGLVATTGELIAGTGFERFRFKDVFISPIGFLEAASLYRSANQNADIGSTFGNIPLSGTANSHMSEFRGTARQSRLGLVAETEVLGMKATAYVESDFLGAAPTANEVESNSWTPRLRQFWGNVEFANGVSVLAGQSWSLLTTHRRGLAPRREFIPLTIDAQYNVGYNWARQFGVRVTKDFGRGVWAAFAIENPETTIGGVNLPANVQGFNTSANATAPASLFVLNNTPGANGISTDLAPDLVGKLVFEPGWGHWEIKGIGRFFRDRVNGGNHFAFGGGVGAAAILPVTSTLNVIAEGLAGSGIGRYASTVGTDVAVRPNGEVVPIRAYQVLTGLEWNPTSAWDVYTYYGVEYYARTALGGNIGYGSQFADLSGCTNEIPGTCQAANKVVAQIQPGFWYRAFQGRSGIGAIGVSYSYVRRDVWSGLNNAQPSGNENIAMVAIRYYFP